MQVLVAPDKFKGTLDAPTAAAAIAEVCRAAGHEPVTLPLADGGEGTLDALGGPNRYTVVANPVGDPVEAAWRFDRCRAVVEMARASGLALVGGAEHNDPVEASTFGTGELIAAAADAGATRIVVGVGGSATTDGGLGALRAMYPLQRYRGIELVVACDVTTRFLEAAEVFAPQKGASAAQVELLRRRLEALAGTYRQDYGVDVTGLEGGGAAGGLAGGLAAIGAELVGGFELVAEEVGFFDALDGLGPGDLVITGEGFVDAESFHGKVVGGVVEAAAQAGVPCLVVAGQVFDELPAGVEVCSLAEECGLDVALADPAGCLRRVVGDRLARLSGPSAG